MANYIHELEEVIKCTHEMKGFDKETSSRSAKLLHGGSFNSSRRVATLRRSSASTTRPPNHP
jgi:hypothetical protein